MATSCPFLLLLIISFNTSQLTPLPTISQYSLTHLSHYPLRHATRCLHALCTSPPSLPLSTSLMLFSVSLELKTNTWFLRLIRFFAMPHFIIFQESWDFWCTEGVFYKLRSAELETVTVHLVISLRDWGTFFFICSKHEAPSPAPVMQALAPATMAAASARCRQTAAAAPLSMVPPVVELSFEDDTPVERQVGDEGGALGLAMETLVLGLSWGTQPKLVLKMEPWACPLMSLDLGLSWSPGPFALMKALCQFPLLKWPMPTSS